VLSLPCATGEEPFSIAMALLDAGFPPRRFRIDAVDISLRAIVYAEQAMYGPRPKVRIASSYATSLRFACLSQHWVHGDAASISRHVPGAKLATLTHPTAARTNRNVGKPTRAVIRRT
jgi:CheR methyltransferase, SAM binding domain